MTDVIFDKQDQLERIEALLLPGEEIKAVLDLKGGGTGFLGITSKRVVFQDNNFLQRMKALVSIPYSRIHTLAAEDDAGMFGGRGFFGSSKIIIGTSSGEYEFEFRGADKGHQAHNMILEYMLGQFREQSLGIETGLSKRLWQRALLMGWRSALLANGQGQQLDNTILYVTDRGALRSRVLSALTTEEDTVWLDEADSG